MGIESERAARAKGTTRLDLGGVRRSPRDQGTTAGSTSESFERSIAALSEQLSAHFTKAQPTPPARNPAPATPAAPDLGLARRADTLSRPDRPAGQPREGPKREGQRQEPRQRQVEEKAGRFREYAFALPLVSGIAAAAAVACTFYFLSGTGPVMPPSSPRPTAATVPRLPPPSPPAPRIVEPAPAAVVTPPKTAPAAPVESKAVEAKAAAPAPDKNVPGKDMLGRNEIFDLQTRLKALGLNPGPVDGVAGPQTAAAVRRYEESRGRPPTGFVDRDLLIRLQQEPPSRTTSR
jgi:hypothetical protein